MIMWWLVDHDLNNKGPYDKCTFAFIKKNFLVWNVAKVEDN